MLNQLNIINSCVFYQTKLIIVVITCIFFDKALQSPFHALDFAFPEKNENKQKIVTLFIFSLFS